MWLTRITSILPSRESSGFWILEDQGAVLRAEFPVEAAERRHLHVLRPGRLQRQRGQADRARRYA
jgi:hypothetical protein